MKRKKPSFNETYYGFRTFSHLLEDAQRRGHRDAAPRPEVGQLHRRGPGPAGIGTEKRPEQASGPVGVPRSAAPRRAAPSRRRRRPRRPPAPVAAEASRRGRRANGSARAPRRRRSRSRRPRSTPPWPRAPFRTPAGRPRTHPTPTTRTPITRTITATMATRTRPTTITVRPRMTSRGDAHADPAASPAPEKPAEPARTPARSRSSRGCGGSPIRSGIRSSGSPGFRRLVALRGFEPRSDG